MIIDCHAHAFAAPRIRHASGADLLLSAEQQIRVMDAKGIDKAVLLQVVNFDAQSAGEIESISAQYPGRFIPFCCFDPRLARHPDHVTAEAFAFRLAQHKELGCRGFGELTTRIPWDDPCLLALLEACRQLEFPVTFHTTSPEADSYGVIDEIGLPRLEKVLAMFPGLRFFGHSAAFWSEISGAVSPEEKNEYPAGPVRPGGRVPELLRRYPDLYGDLSAGSGLNALTRDPSHAYEFIDEFQDRLLFGLDLCSTKQNLRHIEWLTAARDQGHISRVAWDKLMWRNIDRLMRLGLADAAGDTSASPRPARG